VVVRGTRWDPARLVGQSNGSSILVERRQVRHRRRASIHWARLLARIYEFRPLTCPRCHGEMRLVALLTEPASIRAILAHLGEPTTPSPFAPPARAPPEFKTEGAGTAALRSISPVRGTRPRYRRIPVTASIRL